MKIFEKNSKINFVDENNILLGYDNSELCCENFGWFISDKEEDDKCPENKEQSIDLKGYIFDTEYFKEVSYIDGGTNYKYNLLEDRGMVIFRIINGSDQKFIHIFNMHNGYYTHGFEFKIESEIFKEGLL